MNEGGARGNIYSIKTEEMTTKKKGLPIHSILVTNTQYPEMDGMILDEGTSLNEWGERDI